MHLLAAPQLSAIRSRSASSPSPVTAEIGTTSSRRCASSGSRSRSSPASRSTLFQASIRGGAPSSASPSDASTSSTSSRCASRSGCAMLRTWTSRSAYAHLFERRPERRDQLGRQVRHEADRVGQDHLVEPGQADVAHRRVERREQQVLREHSFARQAIEKRRLSGVRIADQRNDRPRRALPPVAVQRPRPLHLVELAPDLRHAVADHPPVGLDLRFAGAAKEAEAAALALEVGPAPHQPARLIVEMRELDLQPPFGGRGALAENLEDQPGAVDHLGAGLLLQVLLLNRASAPRRRSAARASAPWRARRSPRPGPCRARSRAGPCAPGTAVRRRRRCRSLRRGLRPPRPARRPTAATPSRGSSGTAMTARSPRATSIAPLPSNAFRTAPPHRRLRSGLEFSGCAGCSVEIACL